jgi:hypothetical protein
MRSVLERAGEVRYLSNLGRTLKGEGFIKSNKVIVAERVNVVLGIYKHYPGSIRCLLAMLAYIHVVFMHRGRCIGPNKKIPPTLEK